MYAPRFCLVTTKIWSDGHQSLWCVTALGSWTNRVIALRQINVTALFYLENGRRIHLLGVRACRPKDTKSAQHSGERERGRAQACGGERKREHFGSSFYTSFPCPGPALCKLGQPRVLFVLPEVLTLVLGPSFDLPLFYFRGLFPFSHRHFGLLFPIVTT